MLNLETLYAMEFDKNIALSVFISNAGIGTVYRSCGGCAAGRSSEVLITETRLARDTKDWWKRVIMRLID